MRNYRDIGKTGVSFLTAFASGHTLDQDATGEGFLLNPGLYTNLLLPHDALIRTSIPNTQIDINPKIKPNIISDNLSYSTNYFTVERYPTNQHVLVNQNLGSTKYNYEVIPYENS